MGESSISVSTDTDMLRENCSGSSEEVPYLERYLDAAGVSRFSKMTQFNFFLCNLGHYYGRNGIWICNSESNNSQKLNDPSIAGSLLEKNFLLIMFFTAILYQADTIFCLDNID